MFWTAYIGGLSAGLVILSPAEWYVHKKLLHTAKKDRKFYNRASSHAHHDIHHGAFMGPEHYYRDVTNDQETIHFSPIDVVKILGIGAGAGMAVHKAYDLVAGNPSFNTGDVGAALGMWTAAGIGYIGYEASHHYMHVIGERRLAINRTLGDLLQEERDGKLRFTKPLLDDICNAIEDYVDVNAKTNTWPVRYDATLEDRFNEQIVRNKEMGNAIKPVRFHNLMDQLGWEMLDRERALRKTHTTLRQRTGYWWSRQVQHLLRDSDTLIGRYFRHIDNHHFLHHCNYTKNLNVFITWADYAFGTKLDSSKKALDTWQKKHLLCPNSPDVEPFILPS